MEAGVNSIMEEDQILEEACVMEESHVLEGSHVFEEDQSMLEEDQSMLETDQLMEDTEGKEILTETEKQLHDIMEENDRPTYEVDLNKYLSTESSDLAALNSAVLKRGVPPSDSRVLEMFPGKRWERYTLVADGWFMFQRNRAKNGTTLFSCRYGYSHGCRFEVRLKDQKIEWGVPHNHSTDEITECPNFHYMCPYCEERFTDPAKRRAHILEVAHRDAPWPMIEDLCVFAQFDSSTPVNDETPGNKLESTAGLPRPLPNLMAVRPRIHLEDCRVTLLKPNEWTVTVPPLEDDPYPENTLPEKMFTGSTIRISNSLTKKRNSSGAELVSMGGEVKRGRRDERVGDKISRRIDNVIEEYEHKVVLHCEMCDVPLKSLKHRADHEMSDGHLRNKQKNIEETAQCRASLTFNKPIFTEEFLDYNKALEAELRSLRKGAVELEEQNSVLTSHIAELNGVVNELRSAKEVMQRQHLTLETHLRGLKEELTKVFGRVLAEEIPEKGFNETFNRLSRAITSKKATAEQQRMGSELRARLRDASFEKLVLVSGL